MNKEVTVQEIRSKIVSLPGRPPAMLDRDLAEIYGTETKKLNQAVKRNPDRFPDDFCFQLTESEVEILRSQTVTAISPMSRTRPHAFPREGCNMMSACLETPVAVGRSVFIMRAFSAAEAETLRRCHSDTDPGGQITGERFDLSVKRFKVALEAVKLTTGLRNGAEVRRMANEITRDTTGVDLMAFILPYCSTASGQGVAEGEDEADEAQENFVSEWWDRHAGNPVTSRQLYQMIADNKIPLNLGTGSKRSQKVRLSRMLTKMSGRQVGTCRIVGVGKCKGVLSWKLEKIGK